MTKLTAAQYIYASENARELVECLEEVVFDWDNSDIDWQHKHTTLVEEKLRPLINRIRAAESKAKCSIITEAERVASCR